MLTGSDLTAAPASHASRGIPCIDLVPPELFVQILGYLPQHQLRRTSVLSRRFRDVSYSAGLHIHKYVYWNSFDGFQGTLASLEQLVAYAIKENPTVNIAVTVRFDMYTETWDTRRFYRDMEKVFSVLKRALPFLIGLNLCVPVPLTYDLYAALCDDPAPRLREFAFEHNLESVVPIPDNLFKQDAPRLHRVLLRVTGKSAADVDLPPVSAFRHATELRLEIEHADRQISVSNMCPEITRLTLFIDAYATARIDVSGLRNLRSLSVNGGTALLVPDDGLSAIANIEHQHDTIDTFWPDSRIELCARVEISYLQASMITFTPRRGAWRRSFYLTSAYLGAPLPLADVAFLRTQLGSLTLDKALLNSFLELPLSLDALRELFVDLGKTEGYTWPTVTTFDVGLHVPFDGLEARVRCPALERFVFLASGRGITVRPTELARLARAICLDTRPELTLAGCTFSPAPGEGVLNGLFSVVKIGRDSKAHLPEYCETCSYAGQPEWEFVRV